MNDIQTPFLIDLSDLIFDESYYSLKNKTVHNNQKHNEISKKLKHNPPLPSFTKLNLTKPERKLEKIDNLNKAKEKEKIEDTIGKLITKKAINEKIDDFFNQIDISSSLNILLNEKIKKVKPSLGKDLKESIEDNKSVEDFFSHIGFSKKSETEFKIPNEEENRKIEQSNEKGDKDNFYRNNKKSDKSLSVYKNGTENQSNKKNCHSNFDSNKHNHKDKSKKELKLPNGTDHLLKNTNNHFIKVPDLDDRNKNFPRMMSKDSKNEIIDNFPRTIYDQVTNNHSNNLKTSHNKISHLPSQNFVNLIKDSNSHNEDSLNIPSIKFNQKFLVDLKEKLNRINLQNRNKFNKQIYEPLNTSDLTESLEISHSLTNPYSVSNENPNRFFSFYQQTFEDPILRKHIFLHPDIRLRFLKAYPLNKKLISKDYLYNILNGEVKHIYGKIKDFMEKEVFYIKLLKDKDVEEIHTRVFVTEKVLKKKLNKKEISTEYILDELNISEH